MKREFTGLKRTASGSATSGSNGSSTKRRSAPHGARYVVGLNDRGCLASLEKGKVYRLCRDPKAERDGWWRVVDESGEDYLYPKIRFSPVKPSKDAARALASA